MNHAPINHAVVNWNENGTPVSRQFDDVYFSDQDGLEETRHVFLAGNALPERFIHHSRPVFIVAETGFGTGLNFLTLWQAFAVFRRQNPAHQLKRLHFISVEQFPLRVDDAALAHAHWPELAALACELRQQWPLATPGCHRLILGAETITLDLWYGEVNALLPTMDANLAGHVDAWFLDGFSPAKNPAMWSEGLFQSMARFACPQGTFATFTAAGFVRRGLLQAGFNVGKRVGFGRKREMLAGILNPQAQPLENTAALPDSNPTLPCYRRRAATHPENVAIIGGGIASALSALALQRRGARVSLYCADMAPAQGASGNRQGALYPLLNNEDDELSAFFANAFPFALATYQRCARQGMVFEHLWCGVTQLAYDQRAQNKLNHILAADWPKELVHCVAESEMAALTGVETGCAGATYPLGGWLNGQQLTAEILRLAQDRGLTVHYGHEVQHLTGGEHGWILDFAQGGTAHHDAVILANGHRLLQWPITAPLPLTNVRGQVSHIPAVADLAPLKQVLCYDGYLTPASPGYQTHCLGASAHRDDDNVDYRPQEQQQNRDRLLASVPDQPWALSVDVGAAQARCGVRSSARDHLPMVGNVPDYEATLQAYGDWAKQRKSGAPTVDAPVHANLFMLGGLGSRGLCTAPLAAELLAGQIFDEPLPLSVDQSVALSPNRFWIRKLVKGRPL
ncbi:bifunctional tRNA (5-methylaminomethyl-2-thiouridine)(34)-methyltransferase MnmD/FAD-dependent 5-carboxymethylaminomethyl-2-thiouridine(34) oxidoreductase MnmC [Acerihabitans sp. TG2]|uniref:bifunctional tRNA (5-methylaminomethyl-2-thiouridine)(34)-methyltransferase MnmD/FAD-dependent 5-carboxymethylaminomethyl-2-thiouridine(34) oxidoreductase MnmC n=1 Tax=Acerihabitans sp. TG2 TaxID=3096008 RepID=UPI002B23615F|nr:bifunctional tRNA (5-methylaminomethyl-2-thiouridine)(34)-methyltransferase MnmD/FAD-dependent 5-carboxymethylaminomethyl-2-thiouridine(34) oxidoreductase MnmC [Acerihabitans sp. TG2]MEA9389119.1 bifunctional tRNA (5-methylaminomethyl-2-thiouridine)(34)-methyltransferase MnmD/FAD-dependent 5-carboxymethylaminomethyl-2-thiouridine(34) oxidoreductase MnmC [Acerihabitans sp. TG2]